ncbi:uncharacterized protein LOC129718224 [Wyeomyia smithii]|uniref:uncharacterized protein LOC129718224 n=1 Tax=Wyeomyia smithii TaxID=174621 RepID=UPI002467E414|nr:uncharacterized protein LOC129718224 [Wyeomyia smithii]XP_055524762.1 uncharacterized protein LOC129718224 [Wyeomyia smithii]
MEYLAKQSDQRVIRRESLKSKPKEVEAVEDTEMTDIEMSSMIEELKFTTPTTANKARIVHILEETYNHRDTFRKNNDFASYLENFPPASAYNGQMIALDFARMFGLTDFQNKWTGWQNRILAGFNHLFEELDDDFIRCLAIVRAKK